MTHLHENNRQSQAILEENRERLTKQCYQVLNLLTSGKRLNVREAMIYYGIGDLRRRVADLKEHGFDIKDNHIGHGRKEWFMEQAA